MSELTIEQYVYRPTPKMSLGEFISQYRKLYKAGEELFAEFNPCEIRDGKCKRGDLCCSGCEYLSDTGCTVEALWCKLWTCRALKPPRVFEEKQIDLTAAANKLLYGTGGRHDLSSFIERFYGKEMLEAWRTTETYTNSTSLM